MDCARVDGELVAFQLAALDGATRAAVEAHLTGCARCVSAYLALKRAMDAGEEAVAPSELTRSRIRKEAAFVLGAPAGKSRRATWAIVATAAAAMIAAPVVYLAMRAPAAVTQPEGAPAQPAVPGLVPASTNTNQTIDTARTTPENLAFL